METVIIWVAMAMYVSGPEGDLVFETPAVFSAEKQCQKAVDSYKNYVKPLSYSFVATCVQMVAPAVRPKEIRKPMI